MSIQLKVTAGHYPNFTVKLERFPSTTLMPQNKGLSFVIGFFILSALLLIFLDFSIAIIIVGAIALLLLIRHKISNLFQPDSITFGQSGVTVSEFSLFKPKQWEALYRSYDGVHLYKISERDRHGDYTAYRTIELKHADPEKTLPLFAKQSKSKHHDDLRFYADMFNLPAFD